MIQKTAGVCGGDACVGRRRLPVWVLAEMRDFGMSDAQITAAFAPPLTADELESAWRYCATNWGEVRRALAENRGDDLSDWAVECD